MTKGRQPRQAGFALIMVLFLVAAGTILGYSYLASSTVKVVSSQNLLTAARAQYLAESGLEHALYVLESNPSLLQNSLQQPLGPFHVDDTDDGYYFSAVEDIGVPGKYRVFAESQVKGITRRSSFTVYRAAGAEIRVTHGMVIGGAGTSLPMGLTINGNVQNNGSFLLNQAHINGSVNSCGVVWDPFHWITGDVVVGGEPIEVPDIQPDQYQSYTLGGTTYTAIEKTLTDITSSDPVNLGGSITSDNVGGVVSLVPQTGDTITVKSNVDFRGTIVVEGNLRLEGSNVQLRAQPGFPVIVVTGQVLIEKNAQTVIEGLVVAQGGFSIASKEHGYSSHTTINGGLISHWMGYDPLLLGAHVISYDEDRCTIHDFTGQQDNHSGTVVILDFD